MKGKQVLNSLESTLRRVAHERDKHERNSWKYRGKVKDVLEEVMIYQDYITQGLTFDPTGYGELKFDASVLQSYVHVIGTIAWTIVSGGINVYLVGSFS